MNALAARSADIAKILLLVGIAYTLGTTVWHFVSGPTVAAPAAVTNAVVRDQPSAPAVNWQDIASRNIFGIAGAAPVQTKVVEPTNKPAKETRLPLTLLGVFQAEHPEDSAAIVAQKGKAGLRYGIGQTMPGNAELVEVYADYIILRRAGVRETLRFPKSDKMISAVEGTNPPASNTGQSTRRAASSAQSARTSIRAGGSRGTAISARPARPDPTAQGPSSAKELVAQYEDKLRDDPEGTLNSVGIEPVTAGDAQGYKLGGLANSPYLRNTGLQSGDVLLSVNGQAVGDIQQDQLRIGSLLSEGTARLEIMRGQRRFFVTAALN